ncbi:MAG: hypothetical protein A2X18_04385 [Bacteroidetes bacterium GWF2_40_14]|nr:MAG: hypothetical protein A2X18_04385 [Bacteroidetes bacterium GWF2_40_14]
MKKTLILVLIPLLFSCKYLNFTSSDAVVAEVGDKVLYESEVKNLIPQGTSPDDSVKMVEQYVNSWALKHLLQKKAESELSKSESDVEQELEDYKSSLLVYKYEKIYLEARLDTVVTDDECKEYYDNYSSNFTLNNSVVKARVIKISERSPNLENIRRMYRANSIEDIDELEKLCYNSADRYDNFNNEWVEISNIAKEIPYDVQMCEREAWSKSYIETNDSLYRYFVFFLDKIAPEGTAPYEFYKTKIKEIIISKRKQELIVKLEKNLIQEALEKNILKTNFNNKDK